MGYNRRVRRFLAIALMMLFGLPAVAPLFALEGTAESSLPICCRKNGAHYCTQRALSAVPEGTAIRSSQPSCPAYPATVTPVRQNQVFLRTVFHLSTETALHAATGFHPTSLPRFLLDRSKQQRGPPSDVA